MNFKQWLINEVLDDVATKDTSNIEIHKKENTGGQQPSYIHNFEKDGYNYQIKLDHEILPVNQTTKSIFPELENVKKDEISSYSINLYDLSQSTQQVFLVLKLSIFTKSYS